MKNLLPLLFISSLIFSAPSTETNKYLWNEKVSLLTYGLDKCEVALDKEIAIASKSRQYLSTTTAYCDYSYKSDQIRLMIDITDIRSLYESWTPDDGWIDEAIKTGEMSLDMVSKGCQKVADDISAVQYVLAGGGVNRYTLDFMNSGLVASGINSEEAREHINNMFMVLIRLDVSGFSTPNGRTGYTCVAEKRGKEYKLFEDINFSITKENTTDYYKRLLG